SLQMMPMCMGRLENGRCMWEAKLFTDMHLTLYLAHEKYPLLDLYTQPPQRPPKPRWARRKDPSPSDSDVKDSSSSDRSPSPPPRKPTNTQETHWSLKSPGTVTLQVNTSSGTQVLLTVHL
ncbi:putative E4 protein, partial [Human papillomavirus 160]